MDGGSEVDHRLETAVCLVGLHCDAFEFFQLAEEVLDSDAIFRCWCRYREAWRAFDVAR